MTGQRAFNKKRQISQTKRHHVSGEQRLQKPQEETGLINLAYTETGISAHTNHTHYGTFCMCTSLATECMETPTANQSFTELSKYVVHANPVLLLRRGVSASPN